MPGKLCTGAPANNAGAGNLRNSLAYCEGMGYRAKGTALARPITDNPHVDGSEAADSWDLGWTMANDNTAGTISKADQGCCSVSTTIVA